MTKRFFISLLLCLLVLGLACSDGGNTEDKLSDAETDPAASRENIDWQYQMAYQRGIEAMNWAMPAVSMLSLRDANFSLGGGYNTVYWLSKPPTALQEAITPNNQTPYATIHLNTKDGPKILDIPPASKQTAIF